MSLPRSPGSKRWRSGRRSRPASNICSEGGLARLADSRTTATLDELQRRPIGRRSAPPGIDASGKLFIDKDPLKGLMLPLIARLFPAARIIVMRRDPRDVVWSCFRANFAPTPAPLEFTGSGAGRPPL